MSPPDPWTIRRVLAWATEDFRKRGIESPRLDAEVLLSFALDADRLRLVMDADRPLEPEELARFRALVLRRRAREPVAYLTGRREFYGRVFRVDARVLVPRPDTEALVDEALALTRGRELWCSVLDLCTGSGCVGTTLACERRTWAVTGVDLSPDAVALARENAARLGAVWNVRWLVGDLFEPLARGERFDLITANPPYVPSADVETLEPEVRGHEPRLALDGGEDGLVLVRRIAEQARGFLSPGGALALELQFDQTPRALELLSSLGYRQLSSRRDLSGRPRVVSGRFNGP